MAQRSKLPFPQERISPVASTKTRKRCFCFSCLSGGPKQCLHRDSCLLCLLFPFLSCCAVHFLRRFWTHCVSQETPVQTATGYLWAAGHRKRDVAVKHMWRHLTGRNWGSSKDESMQAFEFLAVFTAHIEVILYKHDCHHSLQCQNLLRDHLIG